MKKSKLIFSIFSIVCLILFGQAIKTDNTTMSNSFLDNTVAFDNETPPRISIEHITFEIPYVNSSFKPYMDYRCVTDKNSSQYKFIKKWGWSDSEGFMRCNGEKDLGIADNYYLVALGSYYGTSIGTKYRITLDTGRVFYVVLADCKSNLHTNSTNQYVRNNNIVEFLVDTKRLNKDVKYHGSANVYMPLNGSVSKIERIDFIME